VNNKGRGFRLDRRSKVITAIIRVAIDKGLHDIEVNADRGVRNLLDLGRYFSKGQNHIDFFNRVQQIMSNKNNHYYTLIRRILHNVDHEIIKTFGINLGYNSWTYGAKKIKECEKKCDYKIPWSIIFDLHSPDITMPVSSISETLSCGESLGIYSGMFFTNSNKEYLEKLISALASHRNSAYFVFVQPEVLTDKIVEQAVLAANVAMFVRLKAPVDDYENVKKATDILFDHKCLYGIYSLYDDDNLEYMMSADYAKLVETLNSSFTFLVRKSELKNEKRFAQFLKTTRSAKDYSFFLLDFYDDLARINEIISVENSFITIKANGNIDCKLIDTIAEGLNIKKKSLIAILKQLLPRTQSCY
jgi:hypothetical protein